MRMDEHTCHAALKSRKVHAELRKLHSNPGFWRDFVLKSRTKKMVARRGKCQDLMAVRPRAGATRRCTEGGSRATSKGKAPGK
jgi:hypothetical protein